MTFALSNCLYALPTEGPFLASLDKSTNSGEVGSGGVWLLNFVSDYLKSQKLKSGFLEAYDHCIEDIEALDKIWPIAHEAEQVYRSQGYLAGCESPLPTLARFLVERMPAIWNGPQWLCRVEQYATDIIPKIYTPHTGITRTLVIVDRMDYLVGFFGIGIMPTGSKDPYALRRAAKHLLMQVLFPITRTVSSVN
jgi:hypothetical protein